MAHNALIREQPFYVGFLKDRDLVEIKKAKGLPKIIPLSQNGAPTQARLKTLQTEFFKQADIVGNRIAPFTIMVLIVAKVLAV
jgi:hypothetical protein